MQLKVDPEGWLVAEGERWRCALGRGGIIENKREGDGGTPVGSFRLRRLWVRPDRGPLPECPLPTRAISPEDGWCDDPDSPDYNRPLTLPTQFGHERMWRDDGLYDRVVELGYNDDPPIPGLGSAIFLHCAREGYLPTEGCIALARPDLDAVLPRLDIDSTLIVPNPD